MSDPVDRTPPPPPPPPQPAPDARPEPDPRPEEAQDAAAAVAADDDDNAPSSPEQPQQPPFEPLFTLLTNATTNTTVHPRVHYLFSDDDSSLLANAASDPAHRALVVDLVPSAHNTATTNPAPSPASNDHSPPPPEPTPKDWAVSWASSLSADFAVTGSGVAVQQGDGDGGGGGALMLRVEGVEREPVDLRGGDGGSLPSSGSGAVGREDVDALVEDFRRRMGVLKKVVAEGEARRDVVGRGSPEAGGGEEGAPDAETGAKSEAKDDG